MILDLIDGFIKLGMFVGKMILMSFVLLGLVAILAIIAVIVQTYAATH